MIIANNMVPIIELIKSSENNAGTGALWLGAICFAIQIYFDFSGYSDMAIGLGCMFGFSFPENFNYPYISQSITDFWRRWHISLSTWFRDYVYIPLGGNRVGKVRHIFNILLVWALTGFWHGASWNFLIWGLYYATLLLIEKLFLHKLLDKLPTILKWLVTMFFVLIGWVIFDTLDIALLGQTLKTMLVYTPTDWMGIVASDMSVGFYIFFLPLGIAFSFPIAKKINVNKNNMVHSMFINLIYLGLLALCIFFIVSSTYNPFIYFRF